MGHSLGTALVGAMPVQGWEANAGVVLEEPGHQRCRVQPILTVKVFAIATDSAESFRKPEASHVPRNSLVGQGLQDGAPKPAGREVLLERRYMGN